MSLTILVLMVYFALTLLVAYHFSRKESLEEYFLNKRKTSLWLLTFSNIATIVGAGATVAIVSEVYNSGISYGLALPISFVLGILLMAILSRKIRALKIHTIVDFFETRFDKRNRELLVWMQLFLLVIWAAIQMIAAAVLAQVLTGTEYWVALVLSVAVTVIYTSMGGLKIDIITDFIQVWIILLVFVLMVFFGYQTIGSIDNLFLRIPEGHLNPFAFGDASWFFGVIILGLLVYIPNATHWQRILSAKDQKTAERSFYLSIPFLLVISLMVLFFGLLASAMFKGIPQDSAIFHLMIAILPAWAVGLGFASILAVIMSSVDSLVIVGSTIICRRFYPDKGIKNARLVTIVFGSAVGLVAFLIPNMITMSVFVVFATLILAPAVIAGLYSKSTSSNASFYSIILPFIMLVVLFPYIGKNTFLITTPAAVLIVLFYDKIFHE